MLTPLNVRGSYQTIWGPPLPNVTRHSGWRTSTVTTSIDQALHRCFTLLVILTLLPNLTFYLIARGFHSTYATGAACQQRTLTPPDTWYCPTLGLASVLMLRPMSPELVLFPYFWVSNIPRYLCFCFTSRPLKLSFSLYAHITSDEYHAWFHLNAASPAAMITEQVKIIKKSCPQ